jgi:hypothetical protein
VHCYGVSPRRDLQMDGNVFMLSNEMAAARDASGHSHRTPACGNTRRPARPNIHQLPRIAEGAAIFRNGASTRARTFEVRGLHGCTARPGRKAKGSASDPVSDIPADPGRRCRCVNATGHNTRASESTGADGCGVFPWCKLSGANGSFGVVPDMTLLAAEANREAAGMSLRCFLRGLS